MQLVLAVADEAVDGLDSRRDMELLGEGLGLVERSLAALDRVDDIVLDLCKLVVGELAREDVDLGGSDRGSLLVGEELYALSAGIGSLIELPREVLDGEDTVALVRRQLVKDEIALGLGEDGVLRRRRRGL